jgi:hypothetical protein
MASNTVSHSLMPSWVAVRTTRVRYRGARLRLRLLGPPHPVEALPNLLAWT